MSGWGGFWIMLGLFWVGLCFDHNMTSLRRDVWPQLREILARRRP